MSKSKSKTKTTYPIIIYGKSIIKIYKHYAELVLSKEECETVLVDNDTEILNFVKDRTWTTTSTGLVVSHSPSYVSLPGYIINAPKGSSVYHRNNNHRDYRKANLTLFNNSNSNILNHKYDIEYDSSNNSAKIRVIGTANCEDVIITVDSYIAKAIESGEIHPYAYIEKDRNNTGKIKIPIKEYEKGGEYSNLGRYILGLKKGDPKQAHHIDDDRTNFLKSNLIMLEPSEYADFVKDRQGYAAKKRHESQTKKSTAIKKPMTSVPKPVSNTKNPKGVVDIGNGFFFVSVYNEKTSTLDQIGTFTNKEEACIAYEKRVREICEELARDAYESLVASLMEQYYE